MFGMRLTQKKLDIPEIQSLDVRKIAKDKAKKAYAILKRPVIVEDTALYINSWNNFPGPLIAWVVRTMGIPMVCRLAGRDRKAKAEACVAYCNGKVTETFCGAVKGKIASSPRGSMRFDWDRIFIPEGETRTFAEMTIEEKNRISHRMRAFAKLRDYLSTHQ
jgi:XTP/dITP diphosphohydrolase